MTQQNILAPSILSADFSKLAEEISLLENQGAHWLHLDVMDGHFVPNLTFGPCLVKGIRKLTSLPLDTHLMIANPEKYAQQFIAAGADRITFHIEALAEPQKLVEQIKKLGKKVGIALRPPTPWQSIRPFLSEIDMVLVMSVEPGFGGQKFRPEVLEKVVEIRKQAPEMVIQMDGGINLQTMDQARAAGVNVFVVGSAIFQASQPEVAVKEFLAKL